MSPYAEPTYRTLTPLAAVQAPSGPMIRSCGSTAQRSTTSLARPIFIHHKVPRIRVDGTLATSGGRKRREVTVKQRFECSGTSRAGWASGEGKSRRKPANASKATSSALPSLVWPGKISMLDGAGQGGHGVMNERRASGWYYCFREPVEDNLEKTTRYRAPDFESTVYPLCNLKPKIREGKV